MKSLFERVAGAAERSAVNHNARDERRVERHIKRAASVLLRYDDEYLDSLAEKLMLLVPGSNYTDTPYVLDSIFSDRQLTIVKNTLGQLGRPKQTNGIHPLGPKQTPTDELEPAREHLRAAIRIIETHLREGDRPSPIIEALEKIVFSSKGTEIGFNYSRDKAIRCLYKAHSVLESSYPPHRATSVPGINAFKSSRDDAAFNTLNLYDSFLDKFRKTLSETSISGSKTFKQEFDWLKEEFTRVIKTRDAYINTLNDSEKNALDLVAKIFQEEISPLIDRIEKLQEKWQALAGRPKATGATR